MASRIRAGSPVAFWGSINASNQIVVEAVSANATSREVEISRSVEHIIIYIDTSATTTITVEVAPHAVQTGEAIWPEGASGNDWYTLISGAANTSVTITGAGKQAIQISDFVPGIVRLKSTGAANIAAGFETIGD